MSSETMRSSFRDSLVDLQRALHESKGHPAEVQLIDANALTLRVADGETTPDGGRPGTYYFDLMTRNGAIVLRNPFLDAWETMFQALGVADVRDQHTAFQVFILHELLHVPQRLDSPTHEGVRQHQTILRTVDYHADAFAILLRFHLFRNRDGGDWREALARIIRANLLAIAVFEFYSFDRPADSTEVGPRSYPFDVLLASRLLRHLTWHYQYYRALSMPSDRSVDDFDIKREPILSISHLMDDARLLGGIPAGWTSRHHDLELWIADRNPLGLPVVHRHHASKAQKKWADLLNGIFTVNVNLSFMFFNEFLSRTREVIEWTDHRYEPQDRDAAPAFPTVSITQNAKFVVNAPRSTNLAIGDGASVDKAPRE